jgi:uncharacterized protein
MQKFNNLKELARLKYFYTNSLGELFLKKGIIDNIIDSHTHLGWNYFLAKPVDLFKKNKVKYFFPAEDHFFYLDKYSAANFDKKTRKICQKETLKSTFSTNGYSFTHTIPNIISEMDRLLIDRAVVLPVEMPFLSENSDHILKAVSKTSRLIPFCSVHPFSFNKKNKLVNFFSRGAMGVKIHPPMQLVKPNDEKCFEIYDMAGKFSKPIFFHSGHSPLMPTWQKKFTEKEDFAYVIKRFSKTKFIMGHSGIYDFEFMARLGAKYENVYLDLNGQPPSSIKKIIKIMGADRLLFGSDWPYYPISISLAKLLLATEDNKKIRSKIFFQNTEFLLSYK